MTGSWARSLSRGSGVIAELTDKQLVRIVHPDSFLFIRHNGRCSIKRSYKRVISDLCDTPDEAWASAAKRLGLR